MVSPDAVFPKLSFCFYVRDIVGNDRFPLRLSVVSLQKNCLPMRKLDMLQNKAFPRSELLLHMVEKQHKLKSNVQPFAFKLHRLHTQTGYNSAVHSIVTSAQCV